jgi:hypothetical protein
MYLDASVENIGKNASTMAKNTDGEQKAENLDGAIS